MYVCNVLRVTIKISAKCNDGGKWWCSEVAPPGSGLDNHTVTESSSLGKLVNPDRGAASLSRKHPFSARLGTDAGTGFHYRFT
ncbi:hypothetical protein E2C01_077841 [Portunus trituberculatus]|uniref:Uncharacterized protein n=1 Tax=Portunus trituberculatus TaxID=210409 RepID=A0A5B7INB6_PORTR|nr:hypothetical protein [Portunus trituberculatus]